MLSSNDPAVQGRTKATERRDGEHEGKNIYMKIRESGKICH